MCVSMISGNVVRRARVSGTETWSEQSLLLQMNVLLSLVQTVPVDLKHLSAQCLLLSKILDSLVASRRMPLWRQELLLVIKQVCKHKESPDMRPALLILLLSVKNAYRAEWLSPGPIAERNEVLANLKLLFSCFTTVQEASGTAEVQLLHSGGSAITDAQEARAYVDLINNRFYPRLQVNSVFVAVQAKVGYEVLMSDFQLSSMNAQDRVRLYVGQKDFTETSNCIITPPKVNILVNGLPVERRVNSGYVDTGPQMPSDVTALVRVGANVLQVIGEFAVSYIIAVTSSRTTERSASTTELEEYVAPTKAASAADPTGADDEVVEGESRVSLRCPVSQQRLVTPVKATTCKHLECFDYDSFLDINEQRPAWRCPCCNRLISCPDLRIDRQMEKVLKETDEKVQEVTFNQDGSWIPASTEENDNRPDEASIEGNEKGKKVIDLSDNEEEVEAPMNRKRQNDDVFQQIETKPDAQTIQAIIGTIVGRDVSSQPTNPLVQQRDTVGRPVNSVAESSTVAPQNAPRVVTRPVSHLSPANRPAPIRGYLPTDQLQQPQTGGPSNTGQVNPGETRWVRPRQAGQQPVGTCQLNQSVLDLRPQWRSTAVPQQQQQLGTNIAAQPQSGQQFYANQTTVTNSPRQYYPSGVNPLQHPNSQRSPQQVLQQRPSPGINARPVNRPGNVQGVQRRPSTNIPTQAQVPVNPGASEQNWQPVPRMRGSVTIASLGRGVQVPGPAPQLHQVRMAVSPSGNTFPSTEPFPFNAPPTHVGAALVSFTYPGMDPLPVVTSPAANVSLYNGTNWVNGANFSSSPLAFRGVQTPEGWVSFDQNQNPGTPPPAPPPPR